MGSRTGYGNHIYFIIPIVKKYINLNSGTKRVLVICLILFSSTKLLRVPMIFSILSLQLRTEKIRLGPPPEALRLLVQLQVLPLVATQEIDLVLTVGHHVPDIHLSLVKQKQGNPNPPPLSGVC